MTARKTAAKPPAKSDPPADTTPATSAEPTEPDPTAGPSPVDEPAEAASAGSTTPPTVGQAVLYQLSEEDVKLVNHRRARSARFPQLRRNGEQVHLGNTAAAGDTNPMFVVRVWPDGSVNGQVLLDGNDTLWVTSRQQGDQPGTWSG